MIRKGVRVLTLLTAAGMVLTTAGCFGNPVATTETASATDATTEITTTASGWVAGTEDTTEESQSLSQSYDGNSPYKNYLGMDLYPERLAGNYQSGYCICFEDAVYYAMPDGIYCYHNEDKTKVCDITLERDQVFCTDGYTLYVVDAQGDLVNYDLTADSMVGTAMARITPGSYVVGVGNGCVYYQEPDVMDENMDMLDQFGDVCQVNLRTGDTEVVMEQAYAGCSGGYTFMCARAFDVGPVPMKVLDSHGKVLVEINNCLSIRHWGSHVWYTAGNITDPSTLYYVEQDGPIAVEEGFGDTDSDFGYSMAGFLRFNSYTKGDEYITDYTDMRTDTEIPAYMRQAAGEYAIYAGYQVGNEDFFVTYNTVYRDMGDHVEEYYKLPLESSGAFFANGDGLYYYNEKEGESGLDIIYFNEK